MSRSSEPLLALEDLAAGPLRGASLRVGAGETVKVVLPSGEHVGALFGALRGSAPPVSGRMVLFGADAYEGGEAQRLHRYRRVGAVPHEGGLVSNLKAWENLILPAWYHRGLDAPALEPVVLARLAALGLDERAVTELMPKLPGQLTTAQRRLIALTRAMLMEPDLMIYEDLIAGLERESVSRWLAATSDFQRAAPGRASLYLCPDDAVSERIRADRVVRLD